MENLIPLYHFLARAYLRPPDDDLLELSQDVLSKDFSEDDLQDQFTWLFEFNVYPYASVFIDPSGMLNAPWSGFVSGVFRALGLEVGAGAGLAANDHVSAELEALAVLLEREAKARESQDNLAVARAQHGQRSLLYEQLLPWLPSFTNAIKRIDSGFYGELAALTEMVVLNHSGHLLAEGEVPAFSFPAAEDDISELPSIAKKKDGKARAVLQRLITPARSGMFLSREDITQLGRRLNLPLRFAERSFMLKHLLAAAADQDSLSKLFDDLGQLAATQQEVFLNWQREEPRLAPIWAIWQEKLEHSIAELNKLAEENKLPSKKPFE